MGDFPISNLQSHDIKRRLRRELKARRSALSEAARHCCSEKITTRVCELPSYCTSDTVMLYMALPDEVQTTGLLAHAREHHKRVVVPVVTPEGLLPVVCPTSASHFRSGPFGIPEPRDLSAVVSPREIDIVLVPGLGFDANGVRLGYGGGYYDRFLRLLADDTPFGGLAFHVQLVPSIPQLPHDICMPFVVTEREVVTHTSPPCVPSPTNWQDKGEDR